MLAGISSFFIHAVRAIPVAFVILNNNFGNLLLSAVTATAAFYALGTVREAVRARTVGGHPHLVLQAADEQQPAFTIRVDLSQSAQGPTEEAGAYLELVNHGTGPALEFSVEQFGRLTHFSPDGARWKWLVERNLLEDNLVTRPHGAMPFANLAIPARGQVGVKFRLRYQPELLAAHLTDTDPPVSRVPSQSYLLDVSYRSLASGAVLNSVSVLGFVFERTEKGWAPAVSVFRSIVGPSGRERHTWRTKLDVPPVPRASARQLVTSFWRRLFKRPPAV